MPKPKDLSRDMALNGARVTTDVERVYVRHADKSLTIGYLVKVAGREYPPPFEDLQDAKAMAEIVRSANGEPPTADT